MIIARRGPDLDNLHDLAGKRVMLEHGSADLVAYLRREGVPLDRLTLVVTTFDPAALVEDTWSSTLLLDKLGLYTTEIYQQSREDVILQLDRVDTALEAPEADKAATANNKRILEDVRRAIRERRSNFIYSVLSYRKDRP